MLKIWLLFFSLIFTSVVAYALPRNEISKIKVSKNGNFKYWNAKAESKAKLVEYVKSVTNPKSKDFIPAEERIAVFDMDGTLICETAPSYMEWMVFLDRYLNDSTFKATEEQITQAKEIKKAIDEGKPIGQYDYSEAVLQNLGFVGMTQTEYATFIQNYMDKEVPGFTNMKWGETFYLPMVEIISYLTANGFTCYIVSGTERDICRLMVNGAVEIKRNHVVGSDVYMKTAGQGNVSNLEYVFKKDEDKVVRGELIFKNLKMEKVAKIVTEIGIQPVLAFGNSTGDESMLNYALTGNKYRSLAFLLLADDDVREFGSAQKAAKMQALCDKYGWVPVSMKNDFKTIYGDSVKKR